MSHNAYKATQKAVSSPRQAEYLAFSEATRRLIEASQTTDDAKKVNEAIHANRMLWGTLSDDCSNPANGLPPATRASIISLAIWVSRYSSDAIRKRESLEPLIDINRMIMEGLSGRAA